MDRSVRTLTLGQTSARFRTSAEISLEVIEANIRKQVPAITMAGWLSSAISVKLGYLISRIMGTHNVTEHRYTLFANSSLEAMYAVIRLCRQTSSTRRGPNSHKVLIYDREAQYRHFFDPLSAGAADALCPEVYFARSEAEFAHFLEHDRGWACTIVIRYPGFELSDTLQQKVDAFSKQTGALRVVSHSELALADGSLFRIPQDTDIVIFGESLGNHEVPIAAFSVTESAYSVWGTRQALSTYTSTFNGNTTSLSVAFEALRRNTEYVTEVDKRVFSLVEACFDKRIEYFARYVHPAFADYFRAEKADLNIVRASGSHIQLANGKDVLDLSGLGCSLRGHNPQDLIDEVLKTYDPSVDYLTKIREQIAELTAFSHLLPAVSGAGAVDNALSVALLANAPKKKIVCFSGNYSGKTLPSVNFSRTAPLLADRNLSAFEPYYRDVHHVDPFKEDAKEKFLGLVALVWFELIQGYMLERLPADLVEVVEQNKQRCGYLIGVDEVLTGMWKNGRTMLFHQEQLKHVDITTMSKATSDMVFPVSWALVTDEVLRRADSVSIDTVRRLRSVYRNNLGAAVALNGIARARAFFEHRDPTEALAQFHRDLRGVIAKSALFAQITAAGSLTRLNLNKDWFPYKEGSIEGTLVEGAISKLLLHAAGILLTNLRMFLPVIHDANIYEEILRRLSAGLVKITPPAVYAYMLCHDHETLNALGMKGSFKATILASAGPARNARDGGDVQHLADTHPLVIGNADMRLQERGSSSHA